MPWKQPRSLTSDEVYSLTAFILAKNKLIGENDVMNADTHCLKSGCPIVMGSLSGFPIKFSLQRRLVCPTRTSACAEPKLEALFKIGDPRVHFPLRCTKAIGV